MDLGDFSLSIVVADIDASQAFYEALGFEVIDGQFNHQETFDLPDGQDWLILEHGDTRIGLFQGMFEQNILTFHPEDVRSIQARLDAAEVPLEVRAEGEEGPASILLRDPDGNPILIDEQ